MHNLSPELSTNYAQIVDKFSTSLFYVNIEIPARRMSLYIEEGWKNGANDIYAPFPLLGGFFSNMLPINVCAF